MSSLNISYILTGIVRKCICVMHVTYLKETALEGTPAQDQETNRQREPQRQKESHRDREEVNSERPSFCILSTIGNRVRLVGDKMVLRDALHRMETKSFTR